MKIPNKIKVGNLTYIIKIEKELDAHGAHDCIGNLNEILLNSNLTGDKLRNVFFHELTHAILYEIGAMDETENELFVQSLANELDKLFELKK